jgi:hypothetical protein
LLQNSPRRGSKWSDWHAGWKGWRWVCSVMVKFKLSLYRAMKLYGCVAVYSAPVHIFRYIGRYEFRLLSPSCLSVRQQDTTRFPLHEFLWHFILGNCSELYRQAECCL